MLFMVIERTRRFVQDQYTRLAQQRPGNGETLLLTARQVGRALFQLGVVALRQALDELVGPRQLGRREDFEKNSRPAGWRRCSP